MTTPAKPSDFIQGQMVRLDGSQYCTLKRQDALLGQVVKVGRTRVHILLMADRRTIVVANPEAVSPA